MYSFVMKANILQYIIIVTAKNIIISLKGECYDEKV